MSPGEMGDDFGLMPMTLIRPATRDLPGLLSAEWKRRLKIEWLAVQYRLVGLAG